MMHCKLYEFLESYCSRFPGKNLFYSKRNGQWTPYTCDEVLLKARQIAYSLYQLGIGYNQGGTEGRDKVAIISGNRPEWCIVDYAVQYNGSILVPVFPTISLNDLVFVLNDSAVKAIFVEDDRLLKKLGDFKSQIPSLQHIFLFDTQDTSLNWTQLIKEHQACEDYCKSIHDQLTVEDLATIIYTSGTTGNPKGVMLAHRNISSNVNKCIRFFTMCDENGKALSFLPLNHIFEKMVMYVYLKKGITVYFAEDLGKVGDNLREVKPDLFTTVPRLLEKVYEKIMEKGNALTGLKKKIFFWALGIAERYELKNNGFFYSVQRKIADKLVYSKWREAVGNNVKAIITGGAACQLRLQKIFTCANLIVMEGYGLTETSPVMSINTYEVDGRSFGTIGIPVPGQEVKIAEDGEILAKGDHVMIGYYKNQAATDEVLKDGWFSTGDIGTWVDNKYLKITDRKKELFKLSAGKYIAPQALEGKLKESPYIEQVMVMGADEKYVGALIVPNITNLKSYLKSQGVKIEDAQEIISHELSQKLIKKEVNSLNQSFADYEQIKKFQLLPQEWTIDTGELTPKLSLKRKVISEKYKEVISKLF